MDLGKLTPDQVVMLYRAGQLRDVDVCRAFLDGILDARTVSELLGIPTISVPRHCRKLVRDIEEEMSEEEAEETKKQLSSGGRFGRFGGGQRAVISPTVEVLTKLASDAVTHATQSLDFWVNLGRSVYSVAYFYAARDPRYSERLKVDPMATVRQFVEDALAFYIAHAEILDRIRSTIYRLLDIIDRYDSLLRRVAPRLYPSFLAELETKAMLTLLDRLILARILGVRLGNVPRFLRLWFEYEGEKLVRQHLAQVFGIPPEYLEEVVA